MTYCTFSDPEMLRQLFLIDAIVFQQTQQKNILTAAQFILFQFRIEIDLTLTV